MANISIIGGGRWARTIAGVLVGLDGGTHQVRLHSRHSVAGLRDWIMQKNLGHRIDLAQEGPDLAAARPDAVIVANRVAGHAAAAIPALDAGIPVLVEKPMAIGAENIRRLQQHAQAAGAMLAASHVFLFTRYLENFEKLMAQHGHARRLEMVWEDGRGDVVRGEVKAYDPAVTVFDDVLPHVLPVLARMAQHDLSAQSLSMDQGGAAVTINANAEGLPVSIRLARNAASRRRNLIAFTAGGSCVMDFSTEPGTLSAPGAVREDADPRWNSADLRPLGAMLTAFLQSIREGRLDPRLSPGKALVSAQFADDVRAFYHVQRQSWLDSRSGGAPDAALEYALQEILAQG